MKTIIFCFLIVLLFLPFAYAENVPPKINYQGYLTSGYSGEVSVKVAIVNKDGNTTYWSNDGTSVNGSEPRDAISISATDGFFNVVLGDTEIPNMKALDKAIFGNGERLYMRVWIKAGTDVFERLSPDQEIVSTPYAIKADTADIENIKTALSSDFHNIGGTDDDQPDSDEEVPDNISINNGLLYAPAGGTKVGIGGAIQLDVNGTATARSFIGDGSKLTGIQASTQKVYFAVGTSEIITSSSPLPEPMPDMKISQYFPKGKVYIHFNAPIQPTSIDKRFSAGAFLYIDGQFKSQWRLFLDHTDYSHKDMTIDWVDYLPEGNHTIEIKWCSGYWAVPGDSALITQKGIGYGPRTLTVIAGLGL